MIYLADDDPERLSPQERQELQDRQVSAVVEYAYENSPAMRKKMDGVGITPFEVRCVKDIEKIPVTKKDDLIRLQQEYPPFGGLLAGPLEDVTEIFVSPGPIYDPFSEEVYTKTERVLYAMGFRKGDLVLNTFSYHLVPAGLYLHLALRNMGVKVVPAGVGNTELQLQVIRELQVTGFVGTPSFLMTLIKRAESLGHDFRKDFHLKTAYLSSEMLPTNMRDSFENDYRIHTSQAYAFAEMGITAYECGEKSGMHMAEDFLIEITDPATGKQIGPGEIGEVVVTSFEKTRPLLRLGTGDLSVYTDAPCSCGRTSPRLLRIVGRVGEAIKVRGMFVHPKELGQSLSKFPHVSVYQAVVNRSGHRDEVTLKIELENENIDKEKLSEEILQCVFADCRVKFDRVEYLAKGILPEDCKVIVDKRTWA
jgi:phenylacetate-CoA ligase